MLHCGEYGAFEGPVAFILVEGINRFMTHGGPFI